MATRLSPGAGAPSTWRWPARPRRRRRNRRDAKLVVADLAAARGRYAEHITDVAGVREPLLREAFAKVPREAFLGRGPWLFWGDRSYEPSNGDDPVLLYDDVVVALRPDNGINNGQPSLHARMLAALAVRPGDRVLHVGCGTGYYSAILAELVGPTGTVTAFDVEADLAARARACLRPWPTVAVACRLGTVPPLPESDAIYVNAGATRPAPAWLAALRPGGRLVFPLTGRDLWGGVLRVERSQEGFLAHLVSRCAFIPCEGGRDEDEAARLVHAFTTLRLPDLQSLRLDSVPDASCWFAGAGWWLSTDPP